MVLGLLLSRAGLKTLVLESHPDFEREYRGEVLMPRFTQLMRRIGLFEYLETFPHLKLTGLEGFYRNRPFVRIGIDKIAPEAPFAIWMPQPVLLDALHRKAKENPSFDLWFSARAKEIIRENGAVKGLTAQRGAEEIEISAKVTVGADGRFSALRKAGGFELEHKSHKFDLLWFTTRQPEGYDHQVRFYFSDGRNYLILPKYPDSLQIGVILRVGEFPEFHKKGVEALRSVLMETKQPVIEKFAREVKDFQPFSVLQATIERAREWAKDGIVLVGDAAHTCSPAGAIGVSVAVETAITASEVIEDCFRKKDFSARALGEIQRRRLEDVRGIQNLQENVSAFLFPKSPFMAKVLVPVALLMVTRLGLFRRFQRRLMVLGQK